MNHPAQGVPVIPEQIVPAIPGKSDYFNVPHSNRKTKLP